MQQRGWQRIVLFFILGVSLLLAAYYATPGDKVKEFPSTALTSAAFVLLAVILLDFVHWLAGGEPIAVQLERLSKDLVGSFELLKDSQLTGLQRILGTSRDFERKGHSWMGTLVSARKSVDLMGYSLLIWSTGRDFEGELLALLARGVNVRVLVMDPSNPHFAALVNYHQIPSVKDVDAVKSEVHRAISVFQAVASKAPTRPGAGTFELRKIRTGLVLCQICRVDDWMATIPYLYSVVASESPLLQIRGGGTELFRWYAQEFESLWTLNP